MEIAGWLVFEPGHGSDLAIKYFDCYECEAAGFFTVLHHDANQGWLARWPHSGDKTMPGAVIFVDDDGFPYTNEEVDYVWAAIVPRWGCASIGVWRHARDAASGKVTSEATKYFVDPISGKDQTITLAGREALAWERTLCEARDSPAGLYAGQKSKRCRGLLAIRGTH